MPGKLVSLFEAQTPYPAFDQPRPIRDKSLFSSPYAELPAYLLTDRELLSQFQLLK